MYSQVSSLNHSIKILLFLYLVVHNGIITNYKDIKQFLMTKGYDFESDTDTETIAKMIAHIHSEHPQYNFKQLVEQTISQLEGAFACVFKSSLFPGECVATRRGSPMVIGIKSEFGLEADSIPVQFDLAENKNYKSKEVKKSESMKKKRPSQS